MSAEEEEEEATDGFPEFPPRSLFPKHFRSLTPERKIFLRRYDQKVAVQIHFPSMGSGMDTFVGVIC